MYHILSGGVGYQLLGYWLYLRVTLDMVSQGGVRSTHHYK